MPDGLSLAGFLTPEKQQVSLVAQMAAGTNSLEEAYSKAVDQGMLYAETLADLADDQFDLVPSSRPAGYCAQTLLHFGRLGVNALLDYGATCNAMPEEVAEPKVQRHGIAKDPTEAQMESHACGDHTTFEPWCIDCCQGRAQEWAH